MYGGIPGQGPTPAGPISDHRIGHVADRLRSGVSFWDADLQRTRAYDDEVYEMLRNANLAASLARLRCAVRIYRY